MEEGCFFNFTSVEKLNLPKALENYEGNAFDSNSDNFVEFAISDTNKSYVVTDGILYTKDYKELVAVPCAKRDIEYPSELTSIGDYAFAYNHAGSIQLPETVTKIGKEAFYYSYAEKLYLPSKLKDIDVETFHCMFTLKEFALNEESEDYSVNNGLLYNKNETKLISVPGALEEVSVADTVKTVGSYSCYGYE